jgi:hypothetical protein
VVRAYKTALLMRQMELPEGERWAESLRPWAGRTFPENFTSTVDAVPSSLVVVPKGPVLGSPHHGQRRRPRSGRPPGSRRNSSASRDDASGTGPRCDRGLRGPPGSDQGLEGLGSPVPGDCRPPQYRRISPRPIWLTMVGSPGQMVCPASRDVEVHPTDSFMRRPSASAFSPNSRAGLSHAGLGDKDSAAVGKKVREITDATSVLVV